MQHIPRRRNSAQTSLCSFLLFISYFYNFVGEARDVPRIRTTLCCHKEDACLRGLGVVASGAVLRGGLQLMLRGGDEGGAEPVSTTGTGESKDKESVSVNLREAIKELKEQKTDISDIAAALRLA
jgi:hypothetical protein